MVYLSWYEMRVICDSLSRTRLLIEALKESDERVVSSYYSNCRLCNYWNL